MKTVRTLFSIAAFAIFAASGNGCLPMSGGYAADPAIPDSVVVVTGDGSATVSWGLQVPENTSASDVWVRVQHATNGGPGEQCTRYEPEAGCAVGCDVIGVAVTECTVFGLSPGSYVFTVIVKTNPVDRTEGASSQAYARSGLVTIGTN